MEIESSLHIIRFSNKLLQVKLIPIAVWCEQIYSSIQTLKSFT